MVVKDLHIHNMHHQIHRIGRTSYWYWQIAAARGEPNPKAQASAQATVEKPPTDIKGKKAARISVKPLRKRFSQRIIARGGPSRPKPKKAVVIDLVSDEEEEAQDKRPPRRNNPCLQTKLKRWKKKKILKRPGEYDDPHNWNFDGDLDQWGTDVVGGEPAAAHNWDSTEEEEEDRSTSSASTD
ncbi:hypothetical protein PIB30_063195 [Stylosanthes scabra]|uniref:Uncharacterized protein n=1 Tax=Stylosanthes scabra TaxID=79078 RepID=A0ABU6UK65_9FABA|nr:hypothetical protein [Stylosanthes scabra]